MAEFASMFAKSCRRYAGVALPIALGWTLVGCGATAGADWVNQPESASAWSTSNSESRSLANTPVPRAASIPAPTDAEPAPENHQRLNHTVTLGEVDATPSGDPPPAPYGPAVSVTINNYGQAGGAAPGYGYYGGYSSFGATRSSGFSRAGVTGSSRTGGSGMQPGQNWPSVADHGTGFPLRSSPAPALNSSGRAQ
jgi:hypothetical protein